ncbi:hypothetical protein [Sphingomonas sp. SUN039]|uniref:hypothetical protein n=1 Tax=Sphingomonas sp. SUN039 TaxID=2937787 RepID=UPI002164AF05|nr:hypothetical protein [Sphingomonas sp. SUN039]UVO53679.1 hypothetical protein M0209_05930 [Sphingomonas sp. SUN039]
MLAVATSVFMAGIINALIYTMGFVVLVAIQFLTQGPGGGSFTSAITAFIITLIFTLLLSSIITFVLAFPIALVCRWFNLTGNLAFMIAPAVGAGFACALASVLDVAVSTYVAIVAFAYISAAIMWMALGRSAPVPSNAELKSAHSVST